VDLERWGIDVDDSAGTLLDSTPPGAFLRLLAEAAAENLAPLALISLLKHPLAACGQEAGEFRRRVRALEIALLRGPRPAPGFDGLRKALGTVDAEKQAALAKLIDSLEAALGPFVDLLQTRTLDVAQAIDAHVTAAEALATSEPEEGFARLWAGDAGEQAAGFIAELRHAAASFHALDGGAYPAFFGALLAGIVVRPRYGRHPRLFIWGPLEARLQHADLLILGGLNEGTWPPEPAVDPWMSRPMRAEFGLPEPERRIGLSAHDFAQASAAPEVVLTRALKVDGTPTVPARWLLRLDNLLRAVELGLDREFAKQHLGWHRKLDRPRGPVMPIRPPAPKPPVEARPRKLSVTAIETWMRDPYAIYARHILRLEPLDSIDADPGAAERGSFIHRILDRFVRDFPDALPREAIGALLKIGEDVFSAWLDRPGVRAFWWPRFERIAEWFVEHERLRRPQIAQCATEVEGTLVLETSYKPFTLVGRADRIDRLKAGGLVIIDYKTGTVPSAPAVKSGLSPQLSLEAAMAMQDAFRGVPADEVASVAFWRLTGGEPPGKELPLDANPRELARDALAGLLSLIAKFDDLATAYEARPRPAYAPRFSDYEHLARVKEWSAQDGVAE
jgi:ATP-dependent helicase/nuclease subunit B